MRAGTKWFAVVVGVIVGAASVAQEPTPPAPAPVTEIVVTPPPANDLPSTNTAPIPEQPAVSTSEVTQVTTPEKPPIVIAPVTEKQLGDISIGTRLTYFRLMKEKKETFLGNINRLEAEQDLAPDRLYATWYPTRHVGAELTWDTARAKTHNRNSEIGLGDGDFVFSGPILTLMLRYPNTTAFTPYGGIGMAFLSCSFENDPWWYYGWPSPEAYEDAGSPTEFRNGYKREIRVDNADAFVVVAGCDYRLGEHWFADVYLRYLSLDLDAHYVHGSTTLAPTPQAPPRSRSTRSPTASASATHSERDSGRPAGLERHFGERLKPKRSC